MKILKYLMVITALFFVSGQVFGQEGIKGIIKFIPNNQISSNDTGTVIATAVIPVPAQGAPYHVKAVISKKILQANEKKEQRYIFIKQGKSQKQGAVFTLQDGKIIAVIGVVNPLTEKVSLSLVYKSAPTQDGKTNFVQQKVELSSVNE